MRVRYAIEHGWGDDPEGTVHLGLVDVNGEYVGGTPSPYPNEAEARTAAEQSSDGNDLTWKSAPKEWQPDTYLVSCYYDDSGWDDHS